MFQKPPNLALEHFTSTTQDLARTVMASKYLTLELHFSLEGFIARDPEGVRILTADIGVRTDKKTGARVGALERLREQSTEPGFPRAISVYQAKLAVKHYDLERDGKGAAPYFFVDRPQPGIAADD
ncbi:hypothetical protein CQ020_01915 [Arthrobacter sp. MYb23]|uniref:hypothetical protein n=1 Tax=unclassified Arthrobacter TaxID=235627 RepID=UPI000CFB0C99|nr:MULTISPECIES: hypothetical protein [unclassified Arthrobacter]PRB44974.1 hypothetical protein CQ038_00865 [Arthrobacter sp. MYb51]PRB99563.1 hypothetical protein CQ020_01915 [Arthrobacter sp. MYb23]